MATLLDALSQENLDNQREVVKNEKRWSYDNRPYGSFQEKLQAPPLPAGAPVPPLDDRLDGRPRRGVARGRQRVLPDLLRAEQRGAVGRRRRRDRRRRCGAAERFFGGDPGEPGHPAARRPVAAADARRGAARDGLRPGPAAARPRRVPGAGVRRPAARRARPGRPDPVGRQGQPAQPAARPRGADRPGRRAVHARVHRRRVGHARAGPRSGPGVSVERVEAALHRGARTADDRARQRRRAGPRQGADRGRRARRPPARRGAGRPAVDVRDAVRRPGAHQPDAAALPGGHAGGDPRRRRGGVPARQPAGPDLPARGPAGGRRGAIAGRRATTGDDEVAA